MTEKEQLVYEFSTDVSVKETYAHPQPEGLMAVQDFLFTNRAGGRYVLLRWVMEAEFPVDRFTIELKQMDPVNECLDTVTVTYQGLDIPPLKQGDLFVPAQGIAVQDKCTDIRVRLIEVVSGDFVYRVKGSRVEVDFCAPEPWVYDPRGGREDRLSDTVSLRVGSKLGGKVRFGWPIAILSALLLILLMVLPYLTYDREETYEKKEASHTEETVKDASATGDPGDFRF